MSCYCRGTLRVGYILRKPLPKWEKNGTFSVCSVSCQAQIRNRTECNPDMFTSTAGASCSTLHGTCCDLMQFSSLGELNKFCILLRVKGSGTNKPPEKSTDCPQAELGRPLGRSQKRQSAARAHSRRSPSAEPPQS